MAWSERYIRRVELLVRLLPYVAEEECFALKGGTAINLFDRDIPRLSVDIDLAYLGAEDREPALQTIREALDRIHDRISTSMRDVTLHKAYQQSDGLRIAAQGQAGTVKIELSPVLRGVVWPAETRRVSESVEKRFGFAEMRVLSRNDLYAGKICATLDRQHPRDLFDVHLLLNEGELGRDLIRTFLVYLISHHRPISELIEPKRKDIAALYSSEFHTMVNDTIEMQVLLDAREQLIASIKQSLTPDDKEFLISFKRGEPDWDLLGLPEVMHLPAVQWKQLNLDKMSPDKREAATDRLKDVLR